MIIELGPVRIEASEGSVLSERERRAALVERSQSR
jgi:hypothetical protein